VSLGGRFLARDRSDFRTPPAPAIMRPCATPGCSELVSSGRCAKHTVDHRQRYEQHRGTTAERGYDADHKRLRLQCFIRDGWACQSCGWTLPMMTVLREARVPLPAPSVMLDALAKEFAAGRRHLHADHRLTIAEHPELRLDLDNLQTLCNQCHSRKTQCERATA